MNLLVAFGIVGHFFVLQKLFPWILGQFSLPISPDPFGFFSQTGLQPPLSLPFPQELIFLKVQFKVLSSTHRHMFPG